MKLTAAQAGITVGSKWTCPVMDADPRRFGLCGCISEFDDDNLEAFDAEPEAAETREKEEVGRG